MFFKFIIILTTNSVLCCRQKWTFVNQLNCDYDKQVYSLFYSFPVLFVQKRVILVFNKGNCFKNILRYIMKKKQFNSVVESLTSDFVLCRLPQERETIIISILTGFSHHSYTIYRSNTERIHHRFYDKSKQYIITELLFFLCPLNS